MSASASPLMIAVAEHVLDTALGLAHRSKWARLCPPMLPCLDELPSTAPVPTSRTRIDDIDILRPEEIRSLPERQALVIAESGRPIIAPLHRCIDGRGGRILLAEQQHLRQQLAGRPAEHVEPADQAAIELDEARVRGQTVGRREDYG